jgi:hypothetical protein
VEDKEARVSLSKKEVKRRRPTRRERNPLMTTSKTTVTAISPRSVTASLKIRRNSEAVLSISLELETSPQEAVVVEEAVIEDLTEVEEVAEAALSETEEAEVVPVVATEVAEGATEVAEGAAEVVEVEATSLLLRRTVNSRS